MRSTLIKILIALLPTAPVAGDYLSDIEASNNEESDSDSDKEDKEDKDSSDSNEDSETTMESVIENHNREYPMIYNVDETNIQVGDNFDPMEGVYAVDSTSEVTDNITISGEVNTDQVGDYSLHYHVKGNDNSWYDSTRIVHVTEAQSDEIPPVPKRNDDGSDEDDSDDPEDDVKRDTSERVTFIDVEDQTISEGSDFNPKEGIQVIDTDGQDITTDVHVTGDEVDTSETGTYYIAYTVLDRFGEPNAKAVKITVE